MKELNTNIFNASEIHEPKQLLDVLLQYPVMAEERLVAIRYFDTARDQLVSALSEFVTTILKFSCNRGLSPRANSKYHKFLIDKYGKEEFSTPEALIDWATLFADEFKLNIDRLALVHIVEIAGTDLFSLRNELEKLSLSVEKSERIDLEKVKSAVSHTRARKLFAFTDAVLAKNKKTLFSTLEEMLFFGQNPASILFILRQDFSLLAKLKGGITKGMNPYKISILQRHSSRYSNDEIRYALKMLYEADILIKSGKMNDKNATYRAVGAIASKW
jgi:DNA polymerase-3 subunit delta